MKPFLIAAVFGGLAWYLIETQSVAYVVIGLAAGSGFIWASNEDDMKRIHARINAIWNHLDPL